MAETIKVMVVDDHAVVRAGVTSILRLEPGIEIVGEASNGVEAVSKAVELEPDVILMDIYMSRYSGLEAMMTIKEKVPNTKVIILTISEQEEDLFQALRLGAQGYLVKGATISELTDAVKMAAANEVMLSPHIATRLVAEFRQKANAPALSSRETEVLQLVGDGLTNSEIANRLFISESTVRTYLHRLLDKLHLRNRSEATAYATRHHIANNHH